ncbi:hypothetical protein [Devosia sp.]
MGWAPLRSNHEFPRQQRPVTANRIDLTVITAMPLEWMRPTMR